MEKLLVAFYGLTLMQGAIICGLLCLTCSLLVKNVLLGVFFCGCWLCGQQLATRLVNTGAYYNSIWLLQLIDLTKAVCRLLKQFIVIFFGIKNESVFHTAFEQSRLSNSPPREPVDEASTMQSYIIRDFVISWFSSISEEDQCVHQARKILDSLTGIVFDRIVAVDKYSVVEKYALLYQCHLADYQAANLKFKQQPKVRKKKDPTKKEFKRMVDVADAFHHMKKFHPAMQDVDTEYQYLRALAESVLRALLPLELYQCYTGKELLIEILTKNVVVKIVDLIHDPFWLHTTLIQIFSDDKIILVDEPVISSKTRKRSELESKKGQKESAVSIDSQEENTVSFMVPSNQTSSVASEGSFQNLTVPKQTKNIGRDKSSIEEIQEVTSLLFLPEVSDGHVLNTQQNEIRPNCIMGTEKAANKVPQSELHLEEPPTLVTERPHFFIAESENISILSASTNSSNGDHLPEREGPDGASFVPSGANASEGSCTAGNCPQNSEDNCPAEIPQVIKVSEKGHSGGSVHEPIRTFHSQTRDPAPTNSDAHLRSAGIASSMNMGPSCSEPTLVRPRGNRADSTSVDDADDAYSELEGAIHKQPELLFAEIFVTGTENRKETSGFGIGMFTLYTIETLSWHETSVSSWQLTKQTVKRRYREFLTLQERLEEHPKYSKTMKNIKGPSRWKALPFGNMESKMVDKRKLFLQSYLQNVAAYPDLGNSMALREFLAYDGDASIAFVTKAPELPRPDKAIVKTMSGVFKKISNVLPKGDDDNYKPAPFAGHHSRDNLNQRGVTVADYTDWNDTDHLSLQYGESDEDDDEDDMDQVYTRCVSRQDNGSRGSDSPVSEGEFQDALEVKLTPSTHRLEGDGCDITKLTEEAVCEDQTPLTSTILDLAEQSIMARDTWIRKQKVVHTFKVLLARALETWFKNEVDDATTKERCAYYIRLLTDTLWPDGELDEDPPQLPSELQKVTTKEQARDVLEKFFPSFIPLIVGESEFQYSLDQILTSIEHPKLNRHFAFCLLDLLVDSLLPEVKTTNLRQQLLQPNVHEK